MPDTVLSFLSLVSVLCCVFRNISLINDQSLKFAVRIVVHNKKQKNINQKTSVCLDHADIDKFHLKEVNKFFSHIVPEYR